MNAATATPPSPPTVPIPGWEQLQIDVRAMIEKRRDDPRRLVIESLATAEIERRSKLLIGGLDKLKAANEILAKASKAGEVRYAQDGTALPVTLSQQQMGEIRKAKEAVANIEKAINDALDSADYRGLAKLCGKDDQAKPSPAPGD